MGGIYYLDLSPKEQGDDLEPARQIVRALSEIRDGEGVRHTAADGEYTDVEDRAAFAWKFEYIDFEDREAALKALAIDLKNIDDDWNDCLSIG